MYHQTIFHLVCCLKADCPYPVCKSQSVSQLPNWYDGGPSISFLPLPVPDPARPWGGPDCEQCKGVCHSHFLKPLEALQSDLPPMTAPPSVTLKEAFHKLSHYCKLWLSAPRY